MEQLSIYSKSVTNVPEDYTAASSSYKRHIWIAVLGIVAFFLLYLLLTYWFFFTGWRLLSDGFGGGNSVLISIVGGFASVFLGIFMIKAFFFVNTSHVVQDHQVTASTEPRLFDFLYKLADEIGAPRPNKVYISNRVNASVFYDLSVLNLFWPSKKNLEIGLGLMNVLNLGEVKAVLAHEFGHFAQKSMLVGRWVYIANQIASAIITRRDILDGFLSGLSRIDLRVAWIGWILSLIVWSIRSLVEIVFKLVVLSQRALSREMEFQADLVAVSVTGSDALIHALHKLQAADAAFDNSLGTLSNLLSEQKKVTDLYEIQTNAITQTARILNDPTYGLSPVVPSENPEQNRVFSKRIAQPPKMWSTHPPDQEREANAKENYVHADIDDRNASDLFADAPALRISLTSDLYKGVKVKGELESISTAEVLNFHNQQWDKTYFDPKYKGVYLNRNLFQDYGDLESAYSQESKGDPAFNLYPDSLVEDLEDYTTLKDELLQLEALNDKRLTTSSSNGIWHRGVQVSRQQLPEIIDTMKNEVNIAKSRITDHDMKVRSAHIQMAEKIGPGWPTYLKGLAGVIHYAEHTMEDLKDAYGVFSQVLQIVMADNKVTSAERRRVIDTGNDVQYIMNLMHQKKAFLDLDDRTKEALGGSWDEKLEKLGLPRMNDENIGDWIPASSGWVGSYLDGLSSLRSAALGELLKAENEVQVLFQNQETKGAPNASKIGFEYKKFVPGKEREVVDKLTMWDKFVMSDGIVPSVAKFGVAASIVGATVFAGGMVGNSDLTIYNGLGSTMHVDVGHSKIKVPPHSTFPTHIKLSSNATISTHSPNGALVEEFQPKVSGTSKHYVYNIAQAAALYEYEVVYSTSNYLSNNDQEGKSLGTPRWIYSNANYILEEPPTSLSTSSKQTTREALTAYSNMNPSMLLSLAKDESEISNLVKTHAKWDLPDSPHLIEWLSIADNFKMHEVIDQRVEQYPEEIMTLRLIMDRDEVAKNKICEKYNQKSKDHPDNENYYYINARCMPDGENQDQTFIEGAQKWPENGWLNYATGYVHTTKWKWQQAYDAYTIVSNGVSGLNEAGALSMNRTARLLQSQGAVAPKSSLTNSQALNFYESQIDGKREGGFDNIFDFLQKGELEKAVKLTQQQDEHNYANMKVLIGASDGATPEMIATALKQEASKLSEDAFIAYLGLCIKKGKSINDYDERTLKLFENEEIPIKDFIQAVRNSNYNKGERIIKSGGLTTQGKLSTLAYVIRGKQIPSKWVNISKHVLYPSERPFIK